MIEVVSGGWKIDVVRCVACDELVIHDRLAEPVLVCEQCLKVYFMHAHDRVWHQASTVQAQS